MMRRALCVAMVFTLFQASAFAQSLAKDAAVALAQQHVAANGYTSLPSGKTKPTLDHESVERHSSHKELLAARFNTLKPKAIGIKPGRKGRPTGWSVAFDYVDGGPSSQKCRVVTMDSDGSGIRIEHVDGFRRYFVGFE